MHDLETDRLDIVKRFVALDKEKRRLDSELKLVKQKIAEAEPEVLNHFQEAGMSQIKLDGVTTYLHRRVFASATDVRVLADHPATSWIVKPTANGQTLSAWVNEQETDDDKMPILPDELKDAIRISEKFSVRTRQA